MNLRLLGVLTCIACPGVALAQSPSPLSHIVAEREQAVRDNERTEILMLELKRSEAQLAALARRKAERFAASDALGVSETEAQLTRTSADIAALQRELAALPGTSRAASGQRVPPSSARTAPSARATPVSTPLSTPATTPWWSVYGKGRRAELAAPHAAPPEAPSLPASTRRWE